MPEEYKQKIERLVERRHGLDHERPILLHKQLTEDEMSVRDNTRTQSVPQVLPTFMQLKINNDLRNRTNNQISETLIEAEEKQKQKEAQERFANMTDEERKIWVQEQRDKTEGLGEADSATDWYHAIEEDPQKRAEWDRQADVVSSVGATIATLPFTAGLGIRGGKHALNVLFNPMKAKTAAGAAAAMTSDVYFGYKGLEHAANTVDKWRNGNFDSEDIPNFALGVMGTLPGISHGMKAYKNATNMFNTSNQINKAKKVASNYYDPVRIKAMSNETVNAPGNAEPIPFKEGLLEYLPKEAFIQKPSPMDEVRKMVIARNNSGQKFAKDVRQATNYQRSGTQRVTSDLIDFTDDINLDYFPSSKYKLIGSGAESFVFDYNRGNVIKIPTRNAQYMMRGDNGIVRDVSMKFGDLDDMSNYINNYYLKDFNKYWFQEPMSLVGYQRRTQISPYSKKEINYYVPVLSQPKATKGFTEGRFTKEGLKKYNDFISFISPASPNKIFIENDLPLPYDMHAGNIMFFGDDVKGVDLHKNGGKIYE